MQRSSDEMRRAERRKKKKLHMWVWVVQSLLSGTFLMAGFIKLTLPIDVLVESTPWVAAVPAFVVRLLGLAEIAGSVGLAAPSFLRYKTEWTVYAALAICALMIFALSYHIVKEEWAALPVNVILCGMAIFVAWGRHGKVPIKPRESAS